MSGLRFAVIGINHNHIYGQVGRMLDAGAEFVAFHAPEDDLAADFRRALPAGAPRARPARDPGGRVHPADRQRRHPRRPRATRRRGDAARQGLHGDKPGITRSSSSPRCASVQAETGRIYSICYSEHSRRAPPCSAGELVAAGAIGQVRPDRRPRAAPAPQAARAPTGSSSARATAASSPTSPRTSSSSSCSSPARPTPRSLSATVGQPRQSRQRPACRTSAISTCATDGTHRLRPGRLVHARRPADLGRRPPDHPGHRGLHRAAQVRRHRRPARHRPSVPRRRQGHRSTSTARDVDCPIGRQLLADILNRTETAMPQAHCFKAMELALRGAGQAGAAAAAPGS